MLQRTLVGLLSALAVLSGGCGDSPLAPVAGSYVLDPIVLDRSTFRTIEIASGSLLLDAIASQRGRFEASSLVRITDIGHAPVEQRTQSRGSYTRSGSYLRLRFANGSTQTFAVEDQGATLRLNAESGDCPGQACLGDLDVLVYRQLHSQ